MSQSMVTYYLVLPRGFAVMKGYTSIVTAGMVACSLFAVMRGVSSHVPTNRQCLGEKCTRLCLAVPVSDGLRIEAARVPFIALLAYCTTTVGVREQFVLLTVPHDGRTFLKVGCVGV